MTMFSAQNLSRQHCYDGGYVGGSFPSQGQVVGLMNRFEGYDCSSEACGLGSDLVFCPIMAAAEDESATESVNEAGSSSKDVQDDDKGNEGWLQLGIGGHTTSQNSKQDPVDDDHQSSRKGELVELNLLPPGSGGGGGGGGSSSEHGRVLLAPRFHVPEFQTPRPLTNITHYGYGTSLLFQHQGTSSSFPRQEINWIYRPPGMAPLPGPIPIASSPSSSSFIPPGPNYFARPFQLQAGINIQGPDMDFRVINPPRRPHSGIWFMLQASQNQAKEPFFPQIPKSYLRIKDGRMTIRLVIKYLVNKLRLESESEVEITCRGQQLLPFLTLQHVRDNIWSLRSDAVTLLPDSSTIDHVMVLHYGRTI